MAHQGAGLSPEVPKLRRQARSGRMAAIAAQPAIIELFANPEPLPR